jgi:L-amino acid N-acyltransferase YncA
VDLRPLQPGDLPRLLALHNAAAPVERRWTRAQLENALFDRARAGGRNAVVAWERGVPVGFAGWVSLGAADGEFYGSPVMARDAAVAGGLLSRLLDEARAAGATWVRVGSRADESDKQTALRHAGFHVATEMIELALRVTAPAPQPPTTGLEPVSLAALDHAALAELNNECFRQVANAPALDAETVRESWTRDCWDAASGVLADRDGRYQAFLLVHVGGIIDSIGVRAAHRGAGVGSAMLARAITAAAREQVPVLRSIVTAENLASMALHRRFGFVEEHRRQVWERRLDSP